MEQMTRATPPDSPILVYRSRLRPSRLAGCLPAASAALAASVFAGTSHIVRLILLALSAVFFTLAFERRRVRLDPSAGILTQTFQYGLVGSSKQEKLSDFGSISISVHADDNAAQDAEYTSSYEIYVLGLAQPPVLLYTTGDRMSAEREVELFFGHQALVR